MSDWKAPALKQGPLEQQGMNPSCELGCEEAPKLGSGTCQQFV